MAKKPAKGALIRVALVAGAAAVERVAVRFAPAEYHLYADAGAVLVGGAMAVYTSGMAADVGLGLAAGGAVGIIARLMTPGPTGAARGPAVGAGVATPALATAVYDGRTYRPSGSVSREFITIR